MDPADVVAALWARIEARDWTAARALLDERLVVRWPVTGETFTGPDRFIAVQSDYPTGWSIRVLRIVADGQHVVAEVEVPQAGVGVFRTASFAEVVEGRIRSLTEYWVTLDSETPPAWRAPYRTVN